MANEKRLDLIDRNALLEKGYWHGERPDWGNPYAEGVDAVDTVDIENAPTVPAVEVVHAHWVYDGDEVDGNIQAHCSNCFAGDVHATWKKNNIPYCWNCGAKMDGGNEDG